MNSSVQLALCLNNEGYEVSLEVGHLYQIIPSEQAEAHGLICVVDESGEDYAFSANRFQLVEWSVKVERV